MSGTGLYKSPLRKLVQFFEKSRDSWKAKSLKNKKENRQLKKKLRTLETSKKRWKDEAINLRKQLKNLEQTTEIIENDLVESKKKQELMVVESPLNEINVPYHKYSATTILLLLQFVLSAISLRGSSRVLSLVNDVLKQPLESVPSWFSVRIWLLRLGHYKLMRPKQIADDWCWIVDHTIQLGKTKCLLILGIRLSELPKGRSLTYQDVEPIDLLPVESSTGKVVLEQLEKTVLKTGVPRAIVSDYGSDLKSGIEKFCADQDNCVSLYDIKHKTACLLKAQLSKDENWKLFTQQAAQTKNQLQQTVLSHLKPPNQRSKARYMNIEILLNWGLETLEIINSDDDSIEAEEKQRAKLEWLNDHPDSLEEWDELLQVATLTEQVVRSEGITLNGYQVLKAQFQEKLPDLKYASAITLKENLIDFVKTQGSVCKKDERLLGSSEIIESVFGKQKHLERDYAKEGFTSLILGIGAFVGEMTVDTVKEALIFTPVKTIVKWCKEELGETLQSKKTEAYSKVRNGTKSGLVLCGEN
ncbi:MAG: hypothetical protein GQ569_02330 [Methylococcaceae bacterium]|nr:hypothetical protein [Methylococcaceae bacterium]